MGEETYVYLFEVRFTDGCRRVLEEQRIYGDERNAITAVGRHGIAGLMSKATIVADDKDGSLVSYELSEGRKEYVCRRMEISTEGVE
tara:strand:- start:274 stop:534 length:261 start_codon:yes stop_codon:yes gene_type:complete